MLLIAEVTISYLSQPPCDKHQQTFKLGCYKTVVTVIFIFLASIPPEIRPFGFAQPSDIGGKRSREAPRLSHLCLPALQKRNCRHFVSFLNLLSISAAYSSR